MKAHLSWETIWLCGLSRQVAFDGRESTISYDETVESLECDFKITVILIKYNIILSRTIHIWFLEEKTYSLHLNVCTWNEIHMFE